MNSSINSKSICKFNYQFLGTANKFIQYRVLMQIESIDLLQQSLSIWKF